jgi:hypothetical protein
MTKRVALVSGIAQFAKYNQILRDKYSALGFETIEYKFPRHILFCCHLHGNLESTVKKFVADADVIHCQSSGFFPVLSHIAKSDIRKPLILESPVLNSHTGTLLAATNLAKHYADPKQSKVINFFLDTLAFTPEWKSQTLQSLAALKSQSRVLVLHSGEDNVSDMSGCENLISHQFQKGKHARLFHPESGNDFKVIENFLMTYKA